MNRKVLIVAAVLVVLAVVTVPGVAATPPNNPLPTNGPWATVWNLLVDLQNQINTLKTQIASISPGPPVVGSQYGGRVEQPVVYQDPVAAISEGTAQTDGIISAYAIASFQTFPRYINLRGRVQNPSIVELAHEMDIVMDQVTVSKSITMPIRQGETWEVYVEWEGSATHRLRVIWTPITA